jgi:hypothetical protein
MVPDALAFQNTMTVSINSVRAAVRAVGVRAEYHIIAVRQRRRRRRVRLLRVGHRPDHRRDPPFSYIDACDGATAIALALEHATPGHEVYDIAAPDTGSAIPTTGLLAHHFPDVPVRSDMDEFGSLICADKARDRLGFQARHLWREQHALHLAGQGHHAGADPAPTGPGLRATPDAANP